MLLFNRWTNVSVSLPCISATVFFVVVDLIPPLCRNLPRAVLRRESTCAVKWAQQFSQVPRIWSRPCFPPSPSSILSGLRLWWTGRSKRRHGFGWAAFMSNQQAVVGGGGLRSRIGLHALPARKGLTMFFNPRFLKIFIHTNRS